MRYVLIVISVTLLSGCFRSATRVELNSTTIVWEPKSTDVLGGAGVLSFEQHSTFYHWIELNGIPGHRKYMWHLDKRPLPTYNLNMVDADDGQTLGQGNIIFKPSEHGLKYTQYGDVLNIIKGEITVRTDTVRVALYDNFKASSGNGIYKIIEDDGLKLKLRRIRRLKSE